MYKNIFKSIIKNVYIQINTNNSWDKKYPVINKSENEDLRYLDAIEFEIDKKII